jgi:hypothetical protein
VLLSLLPYGLGSQATRVREVGRVTEALAAVLGCGQGVLGASRDQGPLLLGQGHVEVEHERVDVRPQPGDYERARAGR